MTQEMVDKAVTICQDLAYGSVRPKRRVNPFAKGEGDAAGKPLAMFHKEQVEAVPGHACCRYSMRLGNRNY
ncbi:MAG: hypothetical protein KC636_18415, partial [Myxococcales bacterium]|nr:hypothetical protein [Myxococcales bacterium]